MANVIRTRPVDDPRNGPVILRRDLLASGHNDRSITRLVRAGDLVRVRRGAFVGREVEAALDDAARFVVRGRAVLAQTPTPVLLSHTSGVAELDGPLWGFDLRRVHVTRTDGLTGRLGTDVQQHVGVLRAGDLVVVNDVPSMHPARLALETVTLGNPEASLCVMNDFVHRGLTTIDELHHHCVSMQTWPGMLGAEVLLRLTDGRLESVGETRTFWCLYQQRLPMPVPQYVVRDASGAVVARLDFAWPDRRLWLEFDGRVKYEQLLRDGERASEVVLREKRREELVGRLTGWRCLRLTWADLDHPARVADLVRRHLTPAVA